MFNTKIIDLDTWERTTHFNFFKRMDYPQYLISTNIDITNYLSQTKKRNISFYYGMIYMATYTINQLKEFKYRISGDNVVLHDIIHPAFTDMPENSDLFKMVAVNMEGNIETFVKMAKSKSDSQTDYFIKSDLEGRDDLIYITCLPWVSFTNLSHTISFKKDDSIPRLAWGKYFEDDKRILMPFSVQAHHSFVDGIHMGRYFDTLQNNLDTFQISNVTQD